MTAATIPGFSRLNRKQRLTVMEQNLRVGNDTGDGGGNGGGASIGDGGGNGGGASIGDGGDGCDGGNGCDGGV